MWSTQHDWQNVDAWHQRIKVRDWMTLNSILQCRIKYTGALVAVRYQSVGFAIGRLQVRISAGATSHRGLLSLPSLRHHHHRRLVVRLKRSGCSTKVNVNVKRRRLVHIARADSPQLVELSRVGRYEQALSLETVSCLESFEIVFGVSLLVLMLLCWSSQQNWLHGNLQCQPLTLFEKFVKWQPSFSVIN